MTRFGRLLRNLVERWTSRYYEGPEPPHRLAQAVQAFVFFHPHATVAEWVKFTTEFGENCYRSGYVRGLEWAARDLDRRDPVTDPERLLDRRRHDWSWVDLAPDEEVMRRQVTEGIDPYAGMSPEQQALALDSLGRHFGGYRVEVVDMKRR